MLAKSRYSSSVLLLAVVLPALGSAADEESFDRTPQHCLSTIRIDRTDAVDDQHILFYLRGGKVFVNSLPQKCPQLKKENRIMYRVTTTRLCNLDTITVLEQWAGQLTPGFTCPLGSFYPVTKEEARDMKAAAKEEGGRRKAIKSEAVELPPADKGAAGGEQKDSPGAASGAAEAPER